MGLVEVALEVGLQSVEHDEHHVLIEKMLITISRFKIILVVFPYLPVVPLQFVLESQRAWMTTQ